MQDGDFAVVIFPYSDELKKYLEAKQELRELFQSILDAISDDLTELESALREAFSPSVDISREILDFIAQYADGEENEDPEEESFQETVNCYITESGHLSHQSRIPWHTSGFQ